MPAARTLSSRTRSAFAQAAKRDLPALKAAELPGDLRLYDLRHTCATLMLASGVHPKVAAERLGGRRDVEKHPALRWRLSNGIGGCWGLKLAVLRYVRSAVPFSDARAAFRTSGSRAFDRATASDCSRSLRPLAGPSRRAW